MADQFGRVTLHETGGIHTYVLSEGGSLEIHCETMTIKLSAQGLHRMLEFLHEARYNRVEIPEAWLKSVSDA